MSDFPEKTLQLTNDEIRQEQQLARMQVDAQKRAEERALQAQRQAPQESRPRRGVRETLDLPKDTETDVAFEVAVKLSILQRHNEDLLRVQDDIDSYARALKLFEVQIRSHEIRLQEIEEDIQHLSATLYVEGSDHELLQTEIERLQTEQEIARQAIEGLKMRQYDAISAQLNLTKQAGDLRREIFTLTKHLEARGIVDVPEAVRKFSIADVPTHELE